MIKHGEIYFIDLNPVKGREQAGRRPVLILSIDAINNLQLVVTIVVGTKGENIPRDFPTKAVCRWKRYFYVFKFARLIRIVFRRSLPEKFQRKT